MWGAYKSNQIEGFKVTKYSENRVDSTVLNVHHLGSLCNFHCSFYSSGKQYGCQTHRRGDLQIILSDEKPAFLSALQNTEEPLYPNIRRIFHIWANERTGAVFWQCMQARKTKCQPCKVCAGKLTFFSPSGMFELASDTAMASRWGLKMCPMFIQGNRLWIAHSVPFPERPHSLLLRSVRLPRLKQSSKVNIATVLAPFPLTLCAVWTLRLFFWWVDHFHPSVQVQWLQSERFFEQIFGLLLTF